MNRNQEEELISLAFGDLKGPEAEALRRQLEGDPVAARQFSHLCAIKDDLGRLREVPDMQLGMERLRARLLDGGLEPKRFNVLNLAWLPASFALALLAFFSLKPTPDVSRPLVEGPAQTVALDTTRFVRAELTQRLFHPVDDVWLEMSDPIEPDMPVEPVIAQAHRKRPVRVTRLAPAEAAKSRPHVAPSLPVPMSSADVSERDADSAPALAAAPAADSVVLIGNERDRGTGAQIAREVNRNADVVFGG